MTYYVATLAKYVLVEAENEAQAREKGSAGLLQIQLEDSKPDAPINIKVIRPASAEEIEFSAWHQEQLAREK